MFSIYIEINEVLFFRKNLPRKQSNTGSEGEQSKDGYVPPRNLVIHGEVSNEDEVPGFMVTVDEFMAFMKRAQETAGAMPPVKQG